MGTKERIFSRSTFVNCPFTVLLLKGCLYPSYRWKIVILTAFAFFCFAQSFSITSLHIYDLICTEYICIYVQVYKN